VSGVDPGTLKERLLDHRRFVVGKTGTFGSQGASALVGLLRSRRYGTVAFAVLDHGVAVPDARKRQDAFVRALIDAVDAEPWPYETPVRSAYTLAKVD
jgi:D-alanyl-D-alanine carboxypeptidase